MDCFYKDYYIYKAKEARLINEMNMFLDGNKEAFRRMFDDLITYGEIWCEVDKNNINTDEI